MMESKVDRAQKLIAKKIFSWICEIAKLRGKVRDFDYCLNMNIHNDLGVDSLGFMQLITKIEDFSGFYVNIPDDDYSKLTTPNNIAEYIITAKA